MKDSIIRGTKRLCVFVLLALLVTPCLIAGGQPEAATGEAGVKSPPYVVGLSNVGPVNPWKVAMAEEVRHSASQMPDLIRSFHYTDAGGQVAKQIADVEDLMARGVDLLLVTAVSPSALSPVLERAVDRGIVVVSFDNVVDTDRVTLKIQADEEELGGRMMEWLCEQLGGRGRIVMLGGIAGNSTALLRWKGAEDVLENYPNIEVVGTAWVDWAYDKSKAAMESFLAANPVIDGVWTDGGASGQGALTALVEADRLVPLTGTASNGFLRLWRSLRPQGFTSFSVTHPAYCGVPALDYGLRILQGEDIPSFLPSQLEVTTDADIDSLIRDDLSDGFWVHTKLPEEVLLQLFRR